MDVFNKAYAQLADLLKSMTPGARLTAALLVVVAAVSVAYLFNQQVAGADSYLMGGESFSPSQLRDMHAAFGKAGLEAHSDGAKIKVPRGQESKYMAALADANALPPEFGGYLKKAVSTNSFSWISQAQREASWRVARQQELQLTISCMQGIDGAAVHIDQEQPAGFSREKGVITAAVSVKPKPNQALNDDTVRTIRQMVASSVAGLQPEAVTVVDLSNNRLVAGNGGLESRPGGAGEYADSKKRHELEWQLTINHVLAFVPGVLVSTNVELEPEAGPEAPAVVNDTPAGESTGGAALALPANAGREALDKIRHDFLPAAPRKAELTADRRSARQGRLPKRVTVSVAVPATYYETIWHQEHPAPASQPPRPLDAATFATLEAREKQKIVDLVVNLLPQTGQAADAVAAVAVSTFFPPPVPSLPQPDLRAWALAWMGQHGTTLAVVGVALASLLMLRFTLRRTPATGGPLPSGNPLEMPPTFSLMNEDAFDDVAAPTPRGRLKRSTAQGPTLRQELADIVRDDPDTAVSVLRTWIGNAS